MKRYIRNAAEYIFGMSIERKVLVDKLPGFAEVIFDHIMKIVIAPATGNIQFVDKWTGDIGKAVYNASKHTVDGNKRLPAKVYAEGLFDSVFGTTNQDLINLLEDYRDDHPEFGKFEINQEMIKNLISIVKELRVMIPTMIAAHKGKNGIPIPHTKAKVGQIVQKYIPYKSGKENWYK